MDVRNRQSIKDHLQKEDVQERILQYIHKGRAEATVTISRAAELFGITENKLRDWEEYGFLNPLRPGGPKGRRLYTPAELDKLAVIRELINAGYAASEIPPDIEKLWRSIYLPHERVEQPERADAAHSGNGTHRDDATINQRITGARTDLFWRYYVSRVFRLSLHLICEDIPHTTAGLLVPLEKKGAVHNVADIARLGESLVGWLSQSGSSHTLLTSRPSFDYNTDFRIEPLCVMKAGVPQKDSAQDQTLIILPREARPLTLSSEVVATIRTLLKPLYEDARRSHHCFGAGARDVLDPATNLESTANYEDVILNGLMDMVVRVGGEIEGESLWRFCCLLLPASTNGVLSVQQRSLLVSAQSEHSPYIIGSTTFSPQEPVISSTIKALQSGHSISLPNIAVEDLNSVVQPPATPLRSTLALPIEGSDGSISGVIYVASERKHAFADHDQRVLRIIGRMIGELLETYQARMRASIKLREMLVNPAVVDTLFQGFLSENEFVEHIEELLWDIQSRATFQPAEVVSFIAIDIDNQSRIANKYGDRIARELSRAVGLRIQSQLRAFKDEASYKLYHICADRFYILLKGMSIEQARPKAELLRQVLEGSYAIDPLHVPIGQPALAENTITLTNMSVRLGISSYSYAKLKEVLQRCAPQTAIAEARMFIMGFLEEILVLGKREGGNVVMSWDPPSRAFVRLSR